MLKDVVSWDIRITTGNSGSRTCPGLVHEGVPQEVFFALSFDGHTPQGTVAFHEGFKADGQQEGAGDALWWDVLLKCNYLNPQKTV